MLRIFIHAFCAATITVLDIMIITLFRTFFNPVSAGGVPPASIATGIIIDRIAVIACFTWFDDAVTTEVTPIRLFIRA